MLLERNESRHTAQVIGTTRDFVDHSIVIDGCMHQYRFGGSGSWLPRVFVLRPSHNLDVGSVAVIGYRKSAELGADSSVKMGG